MNFFYWLVWGILYLPVRILYPTVVVNKKAHRYKGKALLVCNHMSNMDIVVLKLHEHTKRYVLAKHTLFKNKFLGGLLRGLGGIPVDRENVGLSTVKTVLTLLKQDKQVYIFPEGTRHASIDDAPEIKNGVAMFALKSGAPIIPMALLYKPRIFRMNKIIVGEPIDLSAYAGKKADKEVLAEIGSIVLKQMQDLRKNYISTFKPKKQLKIYKKLAKEAKI